MESLNLVNVIFEKEAMKVNSCFEITILIGLTVK